MLQVEGLSLWERRQVRRGSRYAKGLQSRLASLPPVALPAVGTRAQARQTRVPIARQRAQARAVIRLRR
jgi:hypothetical protein